MAKKTVLTVEGTEVALKSQNQNDYVSLTDIAKYRDKENPSQVISLWMRTFSTMRYLSLWGKLHNPNFKPLISEGFKTQAADDAF